MVIFLFLVPIWFGTKITRDESFTSQKEQLETRLSYFQSKVILHSKVLETHIHTNILIKEMQTVPKMLKLFQVIITVLPELLGSIPKNFFRIRLKGTKMQKKELSLNKKFAKDMKRSFLH